MSANHDRRRFSAQRGVGQRQSRESRGSQSHGIQSHPGRALQNGPFSPRPSSDAPQRIYSRSNTSLRNSRLNVRPTVSQTSQTSVHSPLLKAEDDEPMATELEKRQELNEDRVLSTVSMIEKVNTEETEKGSARTKICIFLSILLLAAGIGVGVYFGVFGDESGVKGTRAPFVQTTKAPISVSPETDGEKAPPISDEKWNRIRGDCGTPKTKPSLGRIVGGTEAVKHSWPWQIGLLLFKRLNGEAAIMPICGGTLVGPRFVITATHCFLNGRRDEVVDDETKYRVLIGGHEKGRETDGAKIVEIESMHHHPDNNLAVFAVVNSPPIHDISVLILKYVVDPNAPSPITAFACLPKPYFRPAVGKRCWATGWGLTYGTGFARKLKQIVQPIVSELRCKKMYGRNGIARHYHLCAGPHRGSQGTCQGDSGGPLVCQHDGGVWVLHGDTSFGPKPCGVSPGVWGQVSYHMNWICCILKDYGPCKEIKCKKK